MKPRHVAAAAAALGAALLAVAAPQANAAGTPKVIVIVGENSTRAGTMKGSPNLTKWATTYGQDTNCWAIRDVNSAHSSQSRTT